MDEFNPESRVDKVCHIELVNIGTMPTTILDIQLTNKVKKGVLKSFMTRDAFKIHQSKSIPCTISPGEVWSCHISLDTYVDFVKRKNPEFHFDISHKNSLMVFKPNKKVNNEAVTC